jgi:hypothetical protein
MQYPSRSTVKADFTHSQWILRARIWLSCICMGKHTGLHLSMLFILHFPDHRRLLDWCH